MMTTHVDANYVVVGIHDVDHLCGSESSNPDLPLSSSRCDARRDGVLSMGVKFHGFKPILDPAQSRRRRPSFPSGRMYVAVDTCTRFRDTDLPE